MGASKDSIPTKLGGFRRDSLPELDYTALVRASRKLAPSAGAPSLRIALLSDAATQQFVPLLKVLFFGNGFDAEFYEAPFDGIELEAYNAESGLYHFQPHAIVLLQATQALRTGFHRRGGSVRDFVETTLERTRQVWQALKARSSAAVIQSTYVLPYERFFGNFDTLVTDSFAAVVRELNRRLAESAGQFSGVLVNDIDAIASWSGRKTWFDDRFWDSAKSFCALEHLPPVAKNIADTVLALQGRTVKCVIADLDNTLWGGVIGDDGLEGIRLSAHGDGEAFWRLQHFLRELRNRGILLAVCSKNNLENALLPFEKHPEMVLKRQDITVFVANWEDKASNIRSIRETLNIGFDSMVFLDDNPFERNLVRSVLPEVVVPELPEDPSDYVQYIASLNLFEAISFSREDLQRADLYQKEAERQQAAASFGNADEFLASLDMRITVARFDSYHLPRIAQLIQRSNQFNLTTRRRTESDCQQLMHDTRFLPLYVKLQDRLGDHGLISVVVLEDLGETVAIRDWLMSCRVLVRGVEQYTMNYVMEFAAGLGARIVEGEYIPTAKNAMVSGFYAQFDFEKSGDADGHTHWTRAVSSYRAIPTHIQPVSLEPAVSTL
jgi:FkbH-like protein